MNFNPTKCQVLRVTRLKNPIPPKYFPHSIELKSVSAAKYQGVTISNDLSWGTNIANITKKANQSFGFLKRNIKLHKQELKSTAYKTLILTQLEYASTVWSPHTAADTNKIESVQLRATRWACRVYRQTSSVTKMLENLYWRPLDQSLCIDSRLVIMYKVTYDLVAIPASEYLIPNHRESKFIHPLAYKQIIPTSINYYKYSFFLQNYHTLDRPPPPPPNRHCPAPYTLTLRFRSIGRKKENDINPLAKKGSLFLLLPCTCLLQLSEDNARYRQVTHHIANNTSSIKQFRREKTLSPPGFEPRTPA